MVHSAPARPTQSCRRGGFTLIEILVVVMIIGIVSAAVLLGMGNLGDDRELQNEARRIMSLIEVTSDEAMLQGRDFGLEIMQSAYRFVEYDPLTARWTEVIGDDLLRARQLGQDHEFDLFLEDKRVLLDVDAATTDRADDDDGVGGNYLPHVLVLSSGDITPFVLDIVRTTDEASIRLSASAAGELKLGEDEDE